METQQRIGAEEIAAAIERMAQAIVQRQPDPANVMVAGITNGGIPFGEMLAARLGEHYGQSLPMGRLNITFHRDDLGRNPIPPEKSRTELPAPPDDWTVILADDVIFSGRSARAALSELHDLGRPRAVIFAVLFDRGSRKLPIQPDVAGFTEAVDPALGVHVHLHPGTPGKRNYHHRIMSSTRVPWNRKDLVGIEDLSRDELEVIYAKAKEFKATLNRHQKKQPTLRGYTVVNLFMEPSTRTRLAFEIAATRLSADVITVSGNASSLVKGETLRDTAMNIQALNADLIIMRHSAAGAARYLSRVIDIPVINAGDGAHEHPTQALLDTFTLREKFGEDLTGIKVTILGDILFSRVARSNIWALQKQGAEVTLAGPSTLVPRAFEQLGVRVCHDLREALRDADAVMLLRIQHERQSSTHFPSLGEYTSMFGLNEKRAGWLKPEAIIMHPGPINRGVELDSALADSGRSVILEQVTNGIAVRMAVLYLCAGYHAQTQSA